MATIDSIIKRRFTKQLENSDKTVYDLFEYKNVDVQMKNWKTGETIIDMKGLEFPKDYTQNACNIVTSKYFRKAGLNDDKGYEYSMKQVADRMVGFWTDALVDEGLITDGEQKQILYDELVYGLLSQKWAPNSPQWFNTGIIIDGMNTYGLFYLEGYVFRRKKVLFCIEGQHAYINSSISKAHCKA